MAIIKSHLPAFAIFVAILSVVNILMGQSSVSTRAPKPYVVIGEKENGATVKILYSQTILITLPCQLGTGYRWELGRTDQSDWKLHQLDSKEIEELSNRGILEHKEHGGMPGSADIQVFEVKPVSKKDSQVSLQYVRPWARDNAAEKFTVNIRVTE